jgi:hypothetical protein
MVHIDKVPAYQAQGPEFKLQHSQEKRKVHRD